MAKSDYFEYKIKPGNTFSGIIHTMFRVTQSSPRYKVVSEYLLALNPHISNPNQIYAGQTIRLAVLPANIHKIQKTQTLDMPISVSYNIPDSLKNQPFIKQPSAPNNAGFNAFAWMLSNRDSFLVPGAALASFGAYLSSSGMGMIKQLDALYVQYKLGKITPGEYRARRKMALNQLKNNLGPLDKLLLGNNVSPQVKRFAQGGAIPLTKQIKRYESKLERLGNQSKYGGIALTGIGLTAACVEIAKTASRKEKNEIFVDTLVSTGVGFLLGYVVTVYLVSNPLGWGTVLVLATGTAVGSYALGKGARLGYNVFGEKVDFVKGTGLDSICR